MFMVGVALVQAPSKHGRDVPDLAYTADLSGLPMFAQT